MPPDGAAAALIRDAAAGVVVAPEDTEGIKAALVDLHARWQDGVLDGAAALGRVAPPRVAPDARRGARAAAGAARVRRLTSFLFLATLFVATFEKVHWNIAGTVGISDVLAILFLASLLVTTKRPRVPLTTAVLLGFFGLFLVVYLAGYFDLSDSDALGQWGKGLTKWVIHFAFLAAAVFWLSRRGRAYFWRSLAWFSAGIVVNAFYGVLQLLDARRGGEPRRARALADHRRRQPDQRLRRDQRRERLPAERDDGRSESPRDHADRAAAHPDAALPAARARATGCASG